MHFGRPGLMGFNVASGFVDKARQPNDENQKLNTIHPSCEADFFLFA